MRIYFLNVLLLIASCGLVEQMENIPNDGVYNGVDDNSNFTKRLIVQKLEKGYRIQFLEIDKQTNNIICTINGTGEKSSLGIWVETNEFGPRLPIILIQRQDRISVELKEKNQDNNDFSYCASDRSPLGGYQIKVLGYLYKR